MGVSVQVLELTNNRKITKAYDTPLDVLVGYMQETAGTDEDGVSNLQKAWQNEFGVAGKIPERSFIRSTINENQEQIREFIARLEERLFSGSIDPGKVDEMLATFVIGLVKKKMKRAKEWAVANSPATIEAKGSDVPLLDTGDLRNNLDWKPSNN
jgi:hypothetical protein